MLLIVFVKVRINVNILDSALSQPFVYPGSLGITMYRTVVVVPPCLTTMKAPLDLQ